MKSNFEDCFYVPIDIKQESKYIERKFIARRGIYKDSFLSSHGFTDYQLRPNVCVAMAVAPELFDADHARSCLKIIEEVLMGRSALGIKTLDPADKNYRGDYHNSDPSHGHNYH